MKKIFKRGMSGLLAVLMAFTVLAGFGTTTAFAASETAESYMISFPRDGDAAQIYSEDAWGHSAKNYMNGWATGSSNYTTLHCMDSFDGKVCYCIEPGLSRNVGDTYHGFGEDFWDNYPSQYNNTIEPDDIIPGELKYMKVITTTTAGGIDQDSVVKNEDGSFEIPSTITVLCNTEQAKLLAKYEADITLQAALVYRGDNETAAKFLEKQDAFFAGGGANE